MTNKEITPKMLGTFVIGLGWTIYQDYPALEQGSLTIQKFLIDLSIYVGVAIVLMLIGGKTGLFSFAMKIWEIVRNKQYTPEQVQALIEKQIIELVAGWNAAVSTQNDTTKKPTPTGGS